MNIKEVDDLRPELFMAIDYKVSQLYRATRNRKNIEEIRDYVLVVLNLISIYIESHENDFRLRSMAAYR